MRIRRRNIESLSVKNNRLIQYLMRKLSSHYIFSPHRSPLKYGILVLDDEGSVIDLIDTGGKMKEESNLEFYPGILTPGFVNTHCHLELSHLKKKLVHRDAACFQRLDALRRPDPHPLFEIVPGLVENWERV